MIEFRNVSFAYPDSTDSGLKSINLTIPDGQCVLLCGRSGCGKTTLTRLSALGSIIFIVTHDYEFVCRTCTRVLHLDGGRIQDDLSVTEELLPTMKQIFDVR